MDPLMNVERSDDGVGPADGEGGGRERIRVCPCGRDRLTPGRTPPLIIPLAFEWEGRKEERLVAPLNTHLES